ncbi:hypothetical protein UA08_03089 [Talaromyces atroroseus]|uniref:DUF7708 domain-containing protein n=1 Tax=Talaromyces atroroseus TaxID=1441469 RepID=A0A225B5C9_TALAT|nr:hypothetical protein UA08_03089 [Talaromyces atroroseus]OKL61127.1 hypothetical protein UA08_03089 [Talaromyces atroroseus]
MHFLRTKKNTEALTHVRDFSHEINLQRPEESLAKGLAQRVKWEVDKENKGERLFADSFNYSLATYRDEEPPEYTESPIEPTDFNEFYHITKELDDSWKKVIEELNKKLGQKIDLTELLEHPTPDKLEGIVRQAQDSFQERKLTKGGTVKEWVHKIARRINNHRYLLDMLPTGDKYLSILTGGLTACVKASIEHQEVADLVSDFLEKLSDQTYKLFRAVKGAPRNDYISLHVTKFYSIMFDALVKILKQWLSSAWNRLTNSFGSTFKKDLKGSMEKMEYHVKEAVEELNSITLQGLGALVQAALVGSQQDFIDAAGWPGNVPIHFMQIHNSSRSPPVEMAKSHGQKAHRDDHHDNSKYGKFLSTTSEVREKENSESWTSQTIQESVAWMDRELYSSLMQWTTSNSSEALWIEGPAVMTEPSQNTLTTAFITAIFQHRRVPVISYFCYYDQRDYESFSCEAELLKMVLALIYQVSTTLPPDISSILDSEDMPDLSPSRVDSIKPRLESLPNAIELLGDMLALGPPLFACCIDSLQILDKEEESARYKACFRRFVEILGNAKPSHPRILKMWLSTDGHSWSLQDAVNEGWFRSHQTYHESEDEPLILDMVRVAGAT